MHAPHFLAVAGVVCTSLAHAHPTPAEHALVHENVAHAAAQYRVLLKAVGDGPENPRTLAQGRLVTVPPRDWTSGFFPGALWSLYEATGDAFWRTHAEAREAALVAVADDRGTHDLGFMLYCSLGRGWRLTHQAAYLDPLLRGAASLASRFNATVGCIKSWDNRPPWQYPVIIDNMMNLEYLLWASGAGHTPRWREIAIRHADTTLANHFRPDGSSYHLVSYDPRTGAVEAKATVQGAADGSAWARGQAWGLYGFTLLYRETRRPRYLDQAVKIAEFLRHHPRMPADKVPYWDFDAPGIPAEPRDASAAAIMSSALLELEHYVAPALGAEYHRLAVAQLESLASPAYRFAAGEGHGFLLQHSTGNRRSGTEVDGPLIYADYYFLEALLRLEADRAPEPAATLP